MSTALYISQLQQINRSHFETIKELRAQINDLQNQVRHKDERITQIQNVSYKSQLDAETKSHSITKTRLFNVETDVIRLKIDLKDSEKKAEKFRAEAEKWAKAFADLTQGIGDAVRKERVKLETPENKCKTKFFWVNGKKFGNIATHLFYSDIIKLAGFGVHRTEVTVTYSSYKGCGTCYFSSSDPVELVEGMRFTAIVTGNA